MNKRTRIKSHVRPMKPRPIDVSGWQVKSGRGLGKLRADIKTGYKWAKEKREKRVEAGETYSNVRPKGVFPFKEFDDGIYRFDSWYKTLKEAKNLCEDIKSMGIKCRMARKKGKFVVYTKEVVIEI